MPEVLKHYGNTHILLIRLFGYNNEFISASLRRKIAESDLKEKTQKF